MQISLITNTKLPRCSMPIRSGAAEKMTSLLLNSSWLRTAGRRTSSSTKLHSRPAVALSSAK
jgi:hypothetical protein